MDIDKCIKKYLDDSTGIGDIIANRIYPVHLPQNPTLPALTYTEVSGIEHHDIGVAFPRYQFSCWADGYDDIKSLGDEIVSAFKRMKTVIGGTSGKQIIQGVLEGELVMYEEDTKLWHRPIDIKIVYVK